MTPASTPSATSAVGRLLIVDDDRGLLRLLERSLRRERFTTAAVASGREAIAWLERHQADLLLLDLNLPDIAGQELVQRLTAMGRAVPFIAITGYSDVHVAVELMRQGAVDYLVKDRQFLGLVPTVVRHAFEQLDREQRLAAAEEALRNEHAFISAVLDTAGALVVVLDSQGRVVRFNRACEQTTGYTFDEVKGKRFSDLFITPEELESVNAVFDRLAAGRFPSQHENCWRTRGGALRSITWSNTVLPGKNGAVGYIISTGLDITERRRLESEILQISELEQRRIGQDLHDGLCQHLAGIEFMSQGLQQKLAVKSKPEAASAAEITKLVREGIAHTRDLARGLSPVVLESEGLMSALQELADRTAKRFGVQCRFRCDVPVLMHDNGVATHLYRIAQEAVGNAVKHGQASHIEVHLATELDRMTLAIRDNGTGLPAALPRPGGMGLRIMQYRAGVIGATLTLQPLSEGGTLVTCTRNRPGERPSGS